MRAPRSKNIFTSAIYYGFRGPLGDMWDHLILRRQLKNRALMKEQHLMPPVLRVANSTSGVCVCVWGSLSGLADKYSWICVAIMFYIMHMSNFIRSNNMHTIPLLRPPPPTHSRTKHITNNRTKTGKYIHFNDVNIFYLSNEQKKNGLL